MAITWTENQTLQAAQTLSAASSDTDDIDLAANSADCVLVQWTGTFHSSATSGCTVVFYASPDSGTTEDTTALHSTEISCDAGNAVTVSWSFHAIPYLAVKRTNDDSSQAISSETVRYAYGEYNA